MALMSREELRDLLTVEETQLHLRGECREVRPDGLQITQAVWASGSLLRVEEPPGRVDTIVGSTYVWHNDPSSGTSVRKARTPDVPNPYTSPRILERRPAGFWETLIDTDQARVIASAQRVRAHGRAAVQLELPGKTGVVRVTADEQTGVWLEARLGEAAWLSWTWVKFETQADVGLFHIEG